MKELIEKLYDNESQFDYETVKEIRKNKGKINSYFIRRIKQKY